MYRFSVLHGYTWSIKRADENGSSSFVNPSLTMKNGPRDANAKHVLLWVLLRRIKTQGKWGSLINYLALAAHFPRSRPALMFPYIPLARRIFGLPAYYTRAVGFLKRSFLCRTCAVVSRKRTAGSELYRVRSASSEENASRCRNRTWVPRLIKLMPTRVRHSDMLESV